MTFEEKRPASHARWDYKGTLRSAAPTGVSHVWQRGRMRVISEAMLSDYRGQIRPHFLISITVGGERATDEECARALRDFGMVGAEEDNHFPGKCRAFFVVADLAPGEEQLCDCKQTDEQVTEADGFTWSKDKADDAGDARAVQAGVQRAVRVLSP